MLHLMEALEDRRLLSATLSFPSSQSIMVFNAVQNQTSPTETLTLTDSGDAPLNLNSISVLNDPNFATLDASRFTIVNAASIPATIAVGQSFTLQLNYKPTSVGINSAVLDLETNDGSLPSQHIALRGIGTVGLGGSNQPSLARILRAYEIPTIVGEGPNDSNEATDSVYPAFPDPSSQEVVMPRLVKAGTGPVTIQVLASFTASGTKPYVLGTYVPGNPNNRSELFFTPTSESQSTYVQPQGATTFDPGSSSFGFYFVSNIKDSGANRIGYSEDQFNTFDQTPTSQAQNPMRKFRFFPMKNPDGSVVPNAFIMTSTEWHTPGGYDFTNIVAIVRNVMAAPNTPASPAIGLQNLTPVPNSNRMIFDRIQIPNAVIGNQVHDKNILQINNTGGSDLVISSVSFSNPVWVLVTPPLFPLTITPGTNTQLTIQFVAQKEPSHPYNETSSSDHPNSGGVYSGTLTVNSNDPNTPVSTVPLAGWWQDESENENEPSAQTMVNLIAGWSTNINPSPIPELTESTSIPSSPVIYGEETVSAYWSVADSARQVSVMQLDSFHTQEDMDDPQGNIAVFSWFPQGGSSHSVITTAHGYGQTFFPALFGTTTPAAALFTPSSPFGLKVDAETSDNTLNKQNGGGGHHMRFYPLRDSAGNLVPNTYIMLMDYSTIPGENFDFNDNIYVISNIRPSAAPAAPTDLYATAAPAGALLQWAPAPGSITGYNVYSSLAATSGFTLLTSTPISQTSFIDASAPPGTTLFYRVTSVSSSNSAESLGIQSGTTTLGTPVTGLQSVDIGAVPSGSTTVVTPQTAFTVVAGGPGVTGNADGFRYIFQQQNGNFDVKTQISSLTVAGNFSTAGIMARSTLDTNSPNVYMSASPVNYRFKDRSTVGGNTTVIVGANTVFPTVWVRLSRVGNVFTGYSSTDGTNWTVTSTVTISLPTALYLGLAVASNATTATTTAQMNSFGISFTGPIANPDTATATAGQSISINVLSNDTDATSTLVPGSVAISTPPNHGGAAIANPDGTFTYTSVAGFTGVETFTYTVNDLNNVMSAAGTVTINVFPPGPIVNPDSFNTIAGQSIVVDVLANDTDSTGTLIRGSVVATAPNHGGNAAVDMTTGKITYTPLAGFTGTETFTYTVTDSNNILSQAATVTFTVTANPLGPIANPDSAQAGSGQSILINVLSNDVDSSGIIDPATVAISQDSNQGGIVQIDHVTGAITYTSAPGFVGTETFSYNVLDSNQLMSPDALVTVVVSAATANVSAIDDSATTVLNAPVSVKVLANDTADGTINPASVKILTNPAHGTATPQANGTVIFTPGTGFVGIDSFTYTVADTNSHISNTATVNLNVGVEISSAKGANKSVTYTDAGGTVATITLGRGTADIFFTSTGAAGTPLKPGQLVITGANRQISSITLSATTAASILTIKSVGKAGTIGLGDISDTGALGRIVAPIANLVGTINVGGLSALQLQSATNAEIQIGAGLPGVTILTASFADSSINSSVPIHSLKANSWTTVSGGSSINAPSIGSLTIGGDFTPSVNLTAVTGMTLGTAKITGNISGIWVIAGNAGVITAGSIASGAAFNISGTLNSLIVKGGGLSANVIATTLGSLNVIGDLTSNLTAGLAKNIKVTGNVTGSTLTFTGPIIGTVALGHLLVTGDINTTTLTSAGDVSNITAGALTHSTINVGTTPGVTLATATAVNLGAHKLASIQLKTAFSDSTILAGTINSASLGNIVTANGGKPEGLAAVTFKSISADNNAVPFHAGAAQLTDETTLNAYLATKGITPSLFGDFKIDIL